MSNTLPLTFGYNPTLVVVSHENHRYEIPVSKEAAVKQLLEDKCECIGVVWHLDDYRGRHTDSWYDKYFHIDEVIPLLMAQCMSPSVKTAKREALIWRARTHVRMLLKNIDDQVNMLSSNGATTALLLLHVNRFNDHPTDKDERKNVAAMLVIANTDDQGRVWELIEKASEEGNDAFTAMVTMRMR